MTWQHPIKFQTSNLIQQNGIFDLIDNQEKDVGRDIKSDQKAIFSDP